MTTYSTLIQDLQDWAEDDSTEFVAEAPLMITRAEERLFRSAPEALVYNKETTGTLTSGTKTLAHGVVTRSIRQFTVTSGSATKFLNRRSESFIDLYTPDSTTTGLPLFYSQTDNENMTFAPTPDANYAYSLKYKDLPTGLSATNASTWFSTNQYDLLLNAALIEAATFKEDDESVARFTAGYGEKIQLFKAEIVSSYKNEDTTGG